MTGINPKLVSTGVWAIAGFLVDRRDPAHRDRPGARPTSCTSAPTRCCAAWPPRSSAAWSRSRARSLGAIADRHPRPGALLQLHDRDRPRAVRALPRRARARRAGQPARRAGEPARASSSRRASPRCPNGCASIWWVQRLPQFIARPGAGRRGDRCRCCRDKSERHQTWTIDPRLRALRGVGRRAHRLGRSAVARADGVRRARRAHRGRAHPRAVGRHRLARHPHPRRRARRRSRSRGRCCSARRFASLVAVLVGIGALRVRGLLLAISTLAFAIAAQVYLFDRPFFTAGRSTVQIPRADIGPLELTHRNRAYYYFVLFVLVVVLLLVGHLRRTGIGRMIVGVRENELAAAAMTVSPARAKLTAFAVGGFVAGLGGVLLGAVNLTFGPRSATSSSRTRSGWFDRGDRRPRQPLRRGRRRAVGRSACPRSGRTTSSCRCSRRASACCIILLYIPGGFVQIGYYARDSLLRWVEKRMGPLDDRRRRSTAPPASLTHVAPLEPADAATPTARVLATDAPHRALRRAHRGRRRRLPRRCPARSIGLIGNNGAGKSTLLNAIGGYVPAQGSVQLLGRDVSRQARAPARRARARPHVPGRDACSPSSPCARPCSSRSKRGDRTSFWGSLLWVPSIRPERRQARRSGGAHRLPRPRPLRRPLHRRALDRHPPHRRARDGARGRAACDLPRRADRRRRAARGRGVRPADPAGAAGARRDARRRRARPAADPVDQRPRSIASKPAG